MHNSVGHSDQDAIAALPIWAGRIEMAPLAGGITNRNFLVRDGARRVVVRVGADIPRHGIMRFNEHAASRAAASCGISPSVLWASPGLLAIDWIDGRTWTPADVLADLRGGAKSCAALLRRVHTQMAAHLRGPLLSFHPFHIVRDYAHEVAALAGPRAETLPDLLARAAHLEAALGPFTPAFCHNDLLAANFIDDGTRLWLIDWDYAGFNTPLFDLANLSTNNGFSDADDAALLACYAPASPAHPGAFAAMRCVSVLREALWALVQHGHSTLDFDYLAYADDYFARFETSWAAFRDAR